MKWSLIFSLVFYYLLHSALANSSVKALLQRYLIPQRFYRLFFNLFAILTLFPVAYFYWYSQPLPIFSPPLLLQILAFIGLLWGLRILFQALAQYDLSEFGGWAYLQQPQDKLPLGQLQTQGWNARVRHPLYFAGLVIVWAIFLIFPNDLVLSIVLLTTIYSYLGARLEEQKLIKAFGKSYENYQQQVPMLFPKWKK